MKPLIAIVAPSGAGKTTLANKLHKRFGYIPLKSYTTRPPRENDDADLSSHIFCDMNEAESFLKQNQIICSSWFADNFYFCTRDQLNNSDIYVTDVKGLKDLQNNYHDKPVLSVYLDVDSSVVGERMSKRGDNNEVILKRLQHDAEAFKDAKNYVNFVCDNSTQDKLNENVEFIDMLFRNYRR